MNFGVPELLIILAIVLLLFGYSRLPQLGKGLGQGIRNFRRGLKGSDEDRDGTSEDASSDQS